MSVVVRCLLVCIAGLLGSCVFAPLGWGWLAVVAWVPLFYGLEGVSAKIGGRLGLLYGFVFYGLTMRWLMGVFSGQEWMMIPLVLMLSSFGMLFGAGYAAGWNRFGRGWVVAVFGAFWWVGVGFVRGELWMLKFPWMSPGLGLGPNWVSPLLGVYGITFLLVLGGLLVLQRGRSAMVGGAILLVMLVSTVFRPAGVKVDEGVRVVAVNAEMAGPVEYLEMAREAGDADVVLFPEYAFGFDVREHVMFWKDLLELAEVRDDVLVFGTKSVMDTGFYNTALVMDGGGVLGSHYKNYPVHFFADGIAGVEAKSVETSRGKMGAPICFDCDYQDVVRLMAADGAEYFVVPSLDAKSWGSQQHFQHAEMFRHRAAENGRWMMVAAGSGMAQLIDWRGERVDCLAPETEGLLEGTLERRSGLTFFTKVGWMFPWVGMFVGGSCFLWVFGMWVGDCWRARRG